MEKFTIEIESKGDYELKKEFKHVVEMDTRNFLALCEAILDHLDLNKIKELAPKDTVVKDV